jgi:hypothetical protein
MVLNIEKIRVEISGQCEKVFKYKEIISTKKGVEVGEFKRMLHFDLEGDEEFEEFLGSVNAFVGKEGYVCWSGERKEEEKLYVSPSHGTLEKKLCRKLFGCYDRKRERMLKTEIVSRSWHHSTYVE